MSDPILAKAEKCLAAWNAFTALDQRQPVPLYCTEHDEWERQHNEAVSAWRYAWCDLLGTVPRTQQGAIAIIDAFLLYQEAGIERTQFAELLKRLKAFLQSAA
jgi:IS5 family transposase